MKGADRDTEREVKGADRDTEREVQKPAFRVRDEPLALF